MKVMTGLELFEGMTGLADSFRGVELAVAAPSVEAMLKSDPDLDWAFQVLIEAGFTPQMFEAAWKFGERSEIAKAAAAARWKDKK